MAFFTGRRQADTAKTGYAIKSGLAGKIIRSSVKSSFRQLIKKDLNMSGLVY